MCNSCNAMMINGVYCHETGCPDAWRDYMRECKNCPTKFKPEEEWQEFCSVECFQDYWGAGDTAGDYYDYEEPEDYDNYASNFDRFSEQLGE